MAAAPDPSYVPTQFDRAPANDGGALGFLDRFFGADTRQAVVEKAQDARDIVTEKAQDARANLSVAGSSLAATARAHPVLAVLTVVGGIAAIGLLANPATRRAAIAGGTALWGKYGDKAQDLLTKR
ncbi:MAG: hypothetical protein Q7T61_11730 [Caulobacter sp.]|nr:hypothetical protein [Caulobacter sp.]